MKHVMIDLETLSLSNNAAIIAIGAVEFSIDEYLIGQKFEALIDITEAMRYGEVDGKTVCWWMEQSDEARNKAFSGSASMYAALNELCNFLCHISECGMKHVRSTQLEDISVWGNGPKFDISILESAFEKFETVPPWKHYNVYDCRTVELLADGIMQRDDFKRNGTKHSALDDAVYQATYVSSMIRAIKQNAKNS